MTRSLFGTVITTKSGNYRGRYRVAGKDYYTPTCPKKTQVRNLLAEVHADMIRGTWQPPTKEQRAEAPASPLTFAQWGERWLELAVAEGFSQNTVRTYTSIVRSRLTPVIGDILLRDLTPEHFKALWRDLKQEVAPKTASAILVAASSCLGWAVKTGIIESNPVQVEGVFSPQRAIRKPVILSADQLNALIDHVRPDLQAAFVFLSWCALRPGEVPPLTRDDIDLDEGTVTVNKAIQHSIDHRSVLGPPKSAAAYRTVAIPGAQLEIVSHHLETYTPASPEALVFYRPQDPGNYVSDQVLRSQFKKAAGEIGLPKRAQLYDLRRTGLTLYGQAGATLADLMARAGHTNAKTAMIYQKATAKRDRELANRM